MSTKSVRQRLVGQALMGFDTTGSVRAPAARTGVEIKPVRNSAKSARERLAGKPLMGFDTKGAVRAPRAAVGGEVKPSA